MKKFFVTLLAAAVAVTSLAGCGGGSAPTQGTTAPKEVQEVTLKVWCPQNQVDTGIMAQQQAAFASEHPEYNIKWVTEVVGEDKCQESVLKDVGEAADVFMFASD